MARANGGAGADHATMRELNRSLVLDLVRRTSPISRAAIAKQTRLAKPTVSAIVDGLLAEGLVREIGVGRTTNEGGRPPILLEFNARSGFYVGVHIGVRRTHVVLADAAGAQVARHDLDTPAAFPAAVAAVAHAVTELLASNRTARRRLEALGVCVPGLVDLDEGVCLLAPNLGWREAPVRRELAGALGGVPVHVHNTSQACAVAETLEGAAHGASDVVLLYAGTGVGAGIVVNGRLHRGMAGVAGEIGHVRLSGERNVCSCGKFGCLETVVSGPAVVRAGALAGVRTWKGEEVDDLAAVVAAAEQGDATARSVLERAGRELGLAASWLVTLLNPQVLVVGGGMAEAGDLLLGPLRAAVAEYSLPQATEQLAIRPWSLGQDAKVRGAVLVAMQESDRSVRLAFGTPSSMP